MHTADSDFQPRAITEFKRAIEENPRLPGAHYLLAAVLLATGGDQSHLEDAETELKKELVISPRDSMTYIGARQDCDNSQELP